MADLRETAVDKISDEEVDDEEAPTLICNRCNNDLARLPGRHSEDNFTPFREAP